MSIIRSQHDAALFAVIGDPVAHSLSPAMHNPAITALGLNARYTAIHVRGAEIAEFTARARQELAGFNITVPHKNTIIPFLDEIEENAAAAASVNTVTVDGGRLLGTSTDGYGLAAALDEEFGLSLMGGNFTFLGCGGAVNAVAWHFAAGGARRLSFVNRTVPRAAALADTLQKRFPGLELAVAAPAETKCQALLSEADVVIQGTSLGLKPDDPPPVPLEYLAECRRFYETIYKPTKLLRESARLGIPAADGRGMLLHQGARSLQIWTGLEPPLEVMRQALDTALESRDKS